MKTRTHTAPVVAQVGRELSPHRSTRRAVVLSAAAWPALAWSETLRAQSPARVRRIGLLFTSASDISSAQSYPAFRIALRDHGWVEAKNIGIEARLAGGKLERLHEFAAEFVRIKVDLIVTSGSTATLPAHKATQSIPIVAVGVDDPVALGLVKSLARPGGNITGLSQMSQETAGKRLELLKDMMPKLSRVGVLWDPQNRGAPLTWRELELPAKTLGVQLQSLEVRSVGDFDKAFADAAQGRAEALFMFATPVIARNPRRLAALAAKHRLASIFHSPDFADAGGLMTYGVDRAELFRRAAWYVDQILQGRKPGDLPIERPTKFELVINMKTAKALGVTMPRWFLLQADRLIG